MHYDKNKKNILFHYGLLFSVLICIVLFINPFGDFPLNDDWSFTRASINLAENGVLKFTDWTSMPLIGQTILGASIIKLFGFSFSALRLLTLFISFLSIVVFYNIILKSINAPLNNNNNKINDKNSNDKEDYKKRNIALLSSLMLFANFYWVNLSFTYMTDIYFIFYALLSIFYFQKYILEYKQENKQDYKPDSNLLSLALALIFLALATLTRQVSLVIPIALFIYSYFNNKKLLLISGLSLIIWAVSFFGFTQVLRSEMGELPAMYSAGSDRIMLYLSDGVLGLPKRIFLNLINYIVYYSFFLFPLFIFIEAKKINKYLFIKLFLIIFIAFALLFGLFNYINPNYLSGLVQLVLEPVPYLFQNSLNTFKQIEVNYVLSDKYIYAFIVYILFTISFVGTYIIQRFRTLHISDLKNMSLITWISLLYLAMMSIASPFSRYLIFTYPLLVLISIKTFPMKFSKLKSLVLIFYILFSVFATRDYLQINRTNKIAQDYLINTLNVGKEKIDAGLEYGGFNFYDYNYQEQENKNWWWVQDNEYLIANGSSDTLELIKSFPYQRAFPPFYKDTIFIYRNK